MRMVARGCSMSIVAAASGPIRRPRAPVTRIFTRSSDSSIATARARPASVVRSQAMPSPDTTTASAESPSSHRIALRAGHGISELRREVQVQPRVAVRLGQRLRDVEPDAQEREAVAQADARRVFERIAEIVDGIAGIHEHRRDEIPRQAALQFDAAGHQVAAADTVAVGVHRRQLLVAVAADAAVAAREEAVLGGQFLELADHARADLRAQLQLQAVCEAEAPLVADEDAREIGVRTEGGGRANQLNLESARHGIDAEE